MDIPRSRMIGFSEKFLIHGEKDNKDKEVLCRIDTGAVMSSMDIKLAESLGLGPAVRTKKVKNANGITQRPVVRCIFEIKGKKYKVDVTLADRRHLKYRVLIGQNLLIKTNLYINPRIKSK